MHQVAVVTPHVTLHDAVCNDVFGMSEALRRRGCDARIYAADWTVSEAEWKVWPVSRIRDFHSASLTVQSAADRKSTRLNSSHQIISYAVFCLKKKNNHETYRHSRHLHN